MRKWLVILMMGVSAKLSADPVVDAVHQPVLTSGTLPVLFITAADSIKSKEDYVDATYYIDNVGLKDYEPVGTVDHQLPLQIRGRGNWTWTGPYEKKPYKLKLGKKQPLLGMPVNKHWALLAHADGNHPFFRNAAGFFVSRRLLEGFTPRQQPVELVLNGHYEGLYFLTETVRVDNGRVNITEQQNGELDDALVSGGWLVEIDNYAEINQVRLSTKGLDLGFFLITYHSPDSLSSTQRVYLRQQMQEVLNTVYTDDKQSTDWEDVLDIHSLARFYVTHEVIDNVEAFLGSCFLYKDFGETRWHFGPVWDCGQAFSTWHPADDFLYHYDNGWPPGIINELVKFPRFQQEIRAVWHEFYPRVYNALLSYLTFYAQRIKTAARLDGLRWHYVSDIDRELSECLSLLNRKKDFLMSQWETPSSASEGTTMGIDLETTEAPSEAVVGGTSYWLGPTIYIKGKKKYIKR